MPLVQNHCNLYPSHNKVPMQDVTVPVRVNVDGVPQVKQRTQIQDLFIIYSVV